VSQAAPRLLPLDRFGREAAAREICETASSEALESLSVAGADWLREPARVALARRRRAAEERL